MALPSKQKFEDGDRDLNDLATMVNGGESVSVQTRLGGIKPTIAKVFAEALMRISATNPRGDWAPSAEYAVKDLVRDGVTWYVCVETHTAGLSFAADSDYWRVHQGVTTADLEALGAALCGLAQGGTVQDAIKYVTPQMFGATANGFSNPLSNYYASLAEAQVAFPHAEALSDEIDWAAWQKAVNTGAPVRAPAANLYMFGVRTLVIGASKPGCVGDGSLYAAGGTVIDYSGTGAAVKIFDSSVDKRVVACRLESFAILVRTAGAKGIDFGHASYSDFCNLFVRLYEANQAAIYGQGNTLGSAPYHNKFDGISVLGQNDGVNFPGQRVFWFAGDGSGLDADGPNANVISNCKRLAGVEVVIDIDSGNGNLFSNIGCEAVRSFVVQIGDGVGAPGRASGNIINGLRVEGDTSCIIAQFLGQASENTLVNYSANSISPVAFDNQAAYNNYCKPQGIVHTVDFYASNIPANAVTKLSPEATGNEGGIVIPFNAVPYSMHVTVNRYAAGGVGSGVVSFYRSGVIHPDLGFVIDEANRFGGRSVQTTPDSSQAYNSFDGENGFAQVDITTGPDWDQTTADVHVQVVFLA